MYDLYKEKYPFFDQVVAQAKDLVYSNCVIDNNVNPDGQLAIQTNLKDENNWLAGIGRSKSRDPEWERSFCHINPLLKNTPIDDYLHWLNIPVYRTRIMVSRPKTCYSIHNDNSPRLHLPLITNTQCNFVFTKPAKLIHMPANGETYWVDTRNEHTFMNGSLDVRLHLVMIVKE